MRAIHPSLIDHQFAACALLTITSLTGAFAADYYVSPQGKDSKPGTEAYPWLTIAKAADTLKAGDTVYIRGGTYALQTPITPKNSGTPDKPITYCAYPGDGTSMPEDIVIRNNICSENEASQMDRYHTVPMEEHTVEHNPLYGPGRYKGNKVVNGNPLFVDPENGDFHLRSGSPAIDSGVSTDTLREDFDGNVRPWGSAPDMGAFEYGSYKPSTGSEQDTHIQGGIGYNG